ncbi:isochorismatase family cysteine hydrolase [Streptoalloteichus hindustanus]|uniref:Nicotinamidase-related amidase n=1 Tax=Streptoalloteichus hindustanus TaxID=2017 RepID=A0A1M4U3M4_STRHI|nr:isochorismatase family cysteine hydrolase [Streptoalloteichus hindustanus]SHE51411.1 Nicotinamidase-related amidase [Streptoalloteichus hindustanus]
MPGRKAVLVVVDAQNGFVSETSRPVVPVLVDLVSRWQANGGDAVFTRYLNYEGSPFERLLGWTRLRERPEIDIVDELAPYAERANAVVDKRVYSFFTDEGSALVRDNGWTDLYLCGIDTECCVLKAAVDTFERNLTPWVLADACASHTSREAHDAGLLLMRKFIGTRQVITTVDLSRQLDDPEPQR